eukprot:TRINITY_DN13408_c0_g1_i1.p1 TRINITY_DN13408_c0_g1~~TRINITY_DN13408_c0_g1_i1.p1  ORF type:complete len:151 (-),score=9.19 TRINITY_DN13408_c0_g1_i1:75-527(-)
MRIARNDGRHDGAIDHSHAFEAMHLQRWINHCIGIAARAHLACTGWVINGLRDSLTSNTSLSSDKFSPPTRFLRLKALEGAGQCLGSRRSVARGEASNDFVKGFPKEASHPNSPHVFARTGRIGEFVVWKRTFLHMRLGSFTDFASSSSM